MRWFGKVGFVYTTETSPGIMEEVSEEREYYGDVLQNMRRWENGISINDNIVIQNRISIVADSFANENIGNMKYITFSNTKWKISSCDISWPRLIITTGEVYNEG